MIEEHPFANTIRILGKGQKGARALTRDEAYDAMKQIYSHAVEPEQLGAFLMLMRVKEETAEEVAGFVEAIRESLAIPDELPAVSIDWSSYAGKRRQLPWYLLAALTLARSGYPVLMHGMHRDDERVYMPQALQALGLAAAENFQQAAAAIERSGFAYIDIEQLSMLTSQLIEKRQLLGLRPPLHTVARMLNPFAAPLMLQGVFHPGYAETHQLAAKLLGQPAALVIKGEGGEIERVPERAVKLYGLTEGELWQEEWPRLLSPDKYVPDNFPDWKHFKAVWEGDEADAYGLPATTGTIALVLRALGVVKDHEQAQDKAQQLWQTRHTINTPDELKAVALAQAVG
jgi:anthranilate phosphoribosyltransferase